MSWSLQRPSPEVSQALFELLQEALVHNWRHFFPGGVMAALEGRQEEVRHQDQFGRVMQAYGQSFLQPDINLFRQNLEGLEALNRKWRLYHKVGVQGVRKPACPSSQTSSTVPATPKQSTLPVKF